MADLNDKLRATGVSRDAGAPDRRTVLVFFNRTPTDNELRDLHDQLSQHGSAAQAVESIGNGWVYDLYNYLDSVLPQGAADEAFRVAPEAIREEIATLQAGAGNVAGIGARHSAQAGRAGSEVAAPPVADADTYAWLSAEAKRLGFKTVYAAIMAASESRRLNGEKK